MRTRSKKVAADLGVSEDEVREMESRMSGQDLGFDLPVGEDDDEAYTPSMYLEDNSSNFVDDLEDAEYTGEAQQIGLCTIYIRRT